MMMRSVRAHLPFHEAIKVLFDDEAGRISTFSDVSRRLGWREKKLYQY